MKATRSPKQRVNITDSCDGLPLDFSNKELKEIKDLISEEPRNGKRKPIEKLIETNHEEKKDPYVLDAKGEEEKKPADDDASNENAEKKNEKDEKAGDSKKNVQEPTSLVVNNNLQNIIQTYNVNIHGTGNVTTGKINDENNMNTAQKMKINLQTCSLIIGYNQIRCLDGVFGVIDRVMFNSVQHLQWLDLQHNYLVTLSDELARFPNLKSLYLHCNYIWDMKEFTKISNLPVLRSVTVHGNPIDKIPNFRLS